MSQQILLVSLNAIKDVSFQLSELRDYQDEKIEATEAIKKWSIEQTYVN